MRKSYISYLFKKLKEGKLLILPSLARQYLGLYLSRMMKKPLAGPLQGSIIVTYNCNLRCSMCNLYNRPVEYAKQGKKALTTEELKRVIDDFKAIGTRGIGFTGGEPFIRKDMLELVRYTKKKGMIAHVSTNGTLINESFARKIMDSGLDAIGFSVDGATAKTHDGIRGLSNFDKVINAIKIFDKLNRKSDKKIVVVVVTVISTTNLDEIKDLVVMLKGLGVDKIGFNPFHDIGVLSDGRPIMQKHKISKGELRKLDEVVDFLVDVKKKDSVIDNSVDFLRMFKYCFRDKPFPIPCYAGYSTFGVDAYGDMYPCFPMAEMGYARSSANIRDINLKKYWKSKKLQNVRDSIRNCRKCYWNCQAEINLLFNAKKIKDL